MELLIKLYSDRTSRIGIKYVYEYLALREYEELIRKFGQAPCSLLIEIIKNKINLTAISDNTGAKVLYKDLEFKIDQLKRLQANYATGFPLEFVHIFPKANTMMVAKPFKKEQFLPVSDLAFIQSASSYL